MRRDLLLLVLAGTTGWAALHHYRQQAHLHQQLAQLTKVLATENDRLSRNAEGTIKSIEAAVAKNYNQPADIALLRRAEVLQACTKHLIETLRTTGGQLRIATGNKDSMPLQHPGTAIGAALSSGAPRWQALGQRLAGYTDTLKHLNLLPMQEAPLRAPDFPNNTPIVESLADLTRLESEILAYQTHALQNIGKRVGARRWLSHPLAIATAQSNVVAPGATYHAQLGLVGYFSANELKMTMACNGRLVPTGSDGTGFVSFRAPIRPGTATWTGTIRLNQNGRDTTFKVVVPYRVARR